MNKFVLLVVANVLLFDLNLLVSISGKKHERPILPERPAIVQPTTQHSVEIPKITKKDFGYLSYDKLVDQLKQWESEAPTLAKTFTYGQSTRGQTLTGIRIGNPQAHKILITACIHGNEPLSTSVVMSYIGNLLSSYNTDITITGVLNSSEIWFVPVVSPDSYPQGRHVDGVDPNRDFPSNRNPNKKSVTPVDAIQKLFLQEKFKAVISGHTWGRVFLTPHGDTLERCKNEADYQRIVGKMCDLTRSSLTFYQTASVSSEALAPGFSPKFDPINIANYYKTIRACEMYNQPIYGTEVDWYYRHGAFAIVMEFGTHQRLPSNEDTKFEFDITWKAFLHFLQEAPLVPIKTSL